MTSGGGHERTPDDGCPEGDEVDRVVAAWRRERPDLDVAPLEVLSRVSRLARHLDLARRGAFARSGLEPGEFDVLSALRRAGPPYELTPGQLLAATLVGSGTTAGRTARLASRGLVEREPHPEDGRGVLVRLTPAGLATVDSALADLLGRELTLLEGLGAQDRGTLAALLRQLVAPLDGN